MGPSDKPLVWLHGEVKTPPFSQPARIEAGLLLRRLQRGEKLSMPHSRPMPSIGPRCHELRVRDENRTWRLVYRLDSDAVVLLEVFDKKTEQTPKAVIQACQDRLGRYDEVGAAFGRNRPAVGFSLDLKELAELAPGRRLQAAIRAPWGESEGLRSAVRRLREQGETVVCILPGHEHEGQEFDCDRELIAAGDQWVVRAL